MFHPKINRCIPVIALFLAAAARGEDYKIKLTRPDKVGDEFIVTVTAKTDQKIEVTANGQAQPAQSDGFTAELHGVMKVLAVNEKTGGATKATCKVDKLTKDGAEVFPAGTVITAEHADKKTTFTVDGEKVDDEKAQVLDLVISVEKPDRDTNDDEEIGSDKPQKAGDTWPIDADKVAKSISEDGLTVSAEELKGESKLVEVKKVNDTDMMVVETNLTADHFKGTLPDGTAIGSGKLNAKVNFVLPTDSASPVMELSSTMHVEIHITIPGGMGSAVITTNRDVKSHRDEVKK